MVDVDADRAARIVLADNRTADLGSYDNEELLGLLDMMDGDLDGTGYDADDLEKLAGDTSGDILPEPGDSDSEEYNFSYSIVVECESEEMQEELLQKFMEDGLNCKAIM